MSNFLGNFFGAILLFTDAFKLLFLVFACGYVAQLVGERTKQKDLFEKCQIHFQAQGATPEQAEWQCWAVLYGKR
jgi:hypothetical protein